MIPSKVILSIVASACVATISSAMEFQVLGAKAASMGGAGIATSPSSLAAYNNPALLANNPEKFTLHIGGGIGLKDTGAGKAVGDLNNLGLSEIIDAADLTTNPFGLTPEQEASLIQAQGIIAGMDNKGFGVNPTADLGLSFGSMGTGLFITSEIGAMANIDQNHLALILEDPAAAGTYYNILDPLATPTPDDYTNTSLEYAINNGLTNLDVVGLALAEIPFAYGHAFTTPYGSVSIGGAAKIMSGKTFVTTLNLDNTDIAGNYDQNSATSTTFGIDLGVAYKPTFSENLTLAAVGKNLNTPSFTVTGRDDLKIEPAVRAGAAYKLGEVVEFALDADLTENKSLYGYSTRYIGGGANFDLSALELNVGLMKNIASTDQAGVIYTAGIATGPDWLHFELSAQMASKSGEVDGTAYPMQAMVNFAISSAW